MPQHPENNKARIKAKRVKNANMNVKLPMEDYRELQRIADEIGGMTLSNMIRILIYDRLDKVRKTGNPRAFLDFFNENE